MRTDPIRDSFDASKNYKRILWIEERDAQAFSLNEWQDITAVASRRFGDRVFKDGAIVEGVIPSVQGGGVLALSPGQIYVRGWVERTAAAELAFEAGKTSGVDTVWLRYLVDRVTMAEDPTLVKPFTSSDAVEERIRSSGALVTSSPDALDDAFDHFDAEGSPLNWTLVGGGAWGGYPAKTGETSCRLAHVTGTETRMEREVALLPSTSYTLHVWVRTAEGEADMVAGNGAYIDLTRTSPAYSPADAAFTTTPTWARFTAPFVSDASTEPVRVRIVIPASAPSTEILVDSILLTTAPLGARDLERHHIPLLFWDRATDAITRAISRYSSIKATELEPPVEGTDIINIEKNEGLLVENATTLFDMAGHARVQGVEVVRASDLDDATHVGVRVTPGRVYVRGRRWSLSLPVPLLLDKALATSAIDGESSTFAFGQERYPLSKAIGLEDFPIEEIRNVSTAIVRILTLTRGAAGGSDSLGISNTVSILAATGGQGGGQSTGRLTGTVTGTVTPWYGNNTLRVRTTNFDGTTGAWQVIRFEEGPLTITEIIAMIQRGGGRGWQSGKLTGNVEAVEDGSGHLRLRTMTQSSSSTIEIDSEANGSTANTLLGFASGGATNTGTGTHWAETTQWQRVGNSIDWAPGADTPGTDEPGTGQTYRVVCLQTVSLIPNTDYRLGGAFGASATYWYKIAAGGGGGQGIPGAAVSIFTPAGGINRLTWNAVANAYSYHVYRAAAEGGPYEWLANVVDVAPGHDGTGIVAFDDDGSRTPVAWNDPLMVETTTAEVVTAGETDIDCVSLAAFPAATTVFLAGSDTVTYTSKTGGGSNTLSGCAGALDHASGVTVRMGPDMGVVSASSGEMGVLNMALPGQTDYASVRGEPTDGRDLIIDYDYYLPRVDSIAISPAGTVVSVQGNPSDEPRSPAVPDGHMELAQVFVGAASATLVITIRRNLDRATVEEVRTLLRDLVDFKRNAVRQDLINQVDKRDSTASKKGIFADALVDDSLVDRGHAEYAAHLDYLNECATVPHDLTVATVSEGTLIRDAASTDVVVDGRVSMLPSTEVVLVAQTQWSSIWPVNPYDVWREPPVPRIMLAPTAHEWTAGFDGLAFITADNVRALLAALRSSVVPGGTLPPWIHDLEAKLSALRNASQGPNFTMQPILVKVEGVLYGANEDNIAGYFAHTPVNLTAVSPGVSGTLTNTVKADSAGRWAATFLTPGTGALGIHEVEGRGPVSSAKAPFTGVLTLPPDWHDRVFICPLAQSVLFKAAATVSGVGLYFADKDPTLPVLLQLRIVKDGFPIDEVVYQTELAPADINTNLAVNGGRTKVLFPTYLVIPAGTVLAITLLSASTQYTVRVAVLGEMGKNPNARIESNPYEPGVLFSSSNAQTWTPHQEADLMFEVFGRSFTPNVECELLFEAVSEDFSHFVIAASAGIPTRKTTLQWDYQINGDGIWRPAELFHQIRPLVLGASLLVRARLRTTNPAVSPWVLLPSMGEILMYNHLTGTVVWAGVAFQQALASGKIFVTQDLPSGGATAAWSMSNDDGGTWRLMETTGTPLPLDPVWAEYDLVMVAGTFADTARKNLRIKVDLATSDRLRPPRVARLGATVV